MDNNIINTPVTFKISIATLNGAPIAFVAEAAMPSADQAMAVVAVMPKSMKAKVRTVCGEYSVEVVANLASKKNNEVNETGCDRFFALGAAYDCEFVPHDVLSYSSMDEAIEAVRQQRRGW